MAENGDSRFVTPLGGAAVSWGLTGGVALVLNHRLSCGILRGVGARRCLDRADYTRGSGEPRSWLWCRIVTEWGGFRSYYWRDAVWKGWEWIMEDFKYLIVGGGMAADAVVGGIRSVDAAGSIGVVGAEADRPRTSGHLTRSRSLGRSGPRPSQSSRPSVTRSITR